VGEVENAELREWGLPVVSRSAVLSPSVAHQLDDWLEGAGTLLVEAPHGYGKSTQLALWLREQSAHTPVVWISENPYIGTWDDAVATLTHALHRLGLIDAGVDGSDQPALFRALHSLREPVIVVHDDFDRLTPARTLPELERAARDFTMIRSIFLTSRHGGDDGDSSADRVIITHRDLSWTTDFARSVLGTSLQDSRSAHRLSEVVDATGGRASAVLDFYANPQRNMRTRDTIAGFYSRWLLDRAAAIDDTGACVSLLLDLAQFIELPLRMLPAFGHSDAGAAITLLSREGLVSVRRSAFGDETVVSLNESHRESLAMRSREALGQVHDQLHLRAAELFTELPIPALAAYHFARCRYYDRAVECLRDSALGGDSAQALSAQRLALSEIPLELLARDVELLALRVLLAHRDPQEDIRSRGDAELRLLALSPEHTQALPHRARSLIAAGSIAALMSRGRVADAVKCGRDAAAELNGLPWEEVRSLGISSGELWSALAEVELVSCEFGRALDLATVAAQWNQEFGDAISSMRAAAVTAVVQAVEGDLVSARAQLAEVALVHSFHELSSGSVPINVAVARFFIAYGEMDPALMAGVAECLRERSPADSAWGGLATAAQVYVQLFSGKVDEARATSRLALRLASSRSTPLLARHAILMAHSDVLLASGQSGEVVSLLRGVVEKATHPFCYASRIAAAALAAGQNVLAVHETEVCVGMRHGHAGGPLAMALVRRAAATEALQLHDAADDLFASAMALLAQRPIAAAFLNVRPDQLCALWARFGRANPVLMAHVVSLVDPWDRVRGQLSPARGALPPESLSARELAVLEHLRERRTYGEIARLMFVSENTVKTHVSHIYRKLRAKSRQEAVELALKLGLLDQER
jgi:ATP/maltotriose-dependent transcriptional regulator MalT